MLPRSNDAIDLGSEGSKFRDLYLGDTTLGANITPNVTNVTDLGTSSLEFRDAHLGRNLLCAGTVTAGSTIVSGVLTTGSFLCNGGATVLGSAAIAGDVTSNKAYCEAYFKDGTISMFNNTQGVWTHINGLAFPSSFNPWIAGLLVKDFTVSTFDNIFGFQYDGAIEKLFRVSVNVCWSMFGGNGDSVELAIGKNGSVKPATVIQSYLDDQTFIYPRNASTSGIFTLQNGEVIEVFARNTTSSQALKIKCCNIQITEV